MRNLLFGILFSSLICSCSVTRPRTVPADGESELYYNPQILSNPRISTEQVSLWGIRLGDSESAVPANRIQDRGVQGWIRCRDGTRYRAEQGSIVTLGVWDPSVIAKLKIGSPADIEKLFGSPDKVEEAEPLRIYRYRGEKMSILWNTRENLVNAINISR